MSSGCLDRFSVVVPTKGVFYVSRMEVVGLIADIIDNLSEGETFAVYAEGGTIGDGEDDWVSDRDRALMAAWSNE